jgi:hypothetical protein
MFFLHFLYRCWIIIVLFLVQGSIFSFGVMAVTFCCYALGVVVCFSYVLVFAVTCWFLGSISVGFGWLLL